MTVTSQVTQVDGVGDGSTTVFSYSPLTIFKSSELAVTHVVDATGVETTLTEGVGSSNYSVSPTTFPALGTTGNVTYPADQVTPMPSGERIIIERVLTLEQQTDLGQLDDYDPDTLEAQLDKIMMLLLQHQELLDRLAPLPISFSGTVGGADAPSASEYVRRNSTNDGYEHSTVASTTGSASDATPQALGVAAAGGNALYSRDDHVHPTTGLGTLSGQNIFTARQRWAKGVDVASADPLVLGTDGNIFDVTGVTGFATITVPSGTWFMLQFDGVLTITNGAAITLQGGANFTTAAGDILVGYATATDTVVATLHKADGTPIVGVGVLPRSYLAGLQLANNGGDAAHDIDVAVGEARDDTDAADMALSSVLVKQIDASWAVGTNQGGLDGTETVAGTPDASTWYHVWLIRRSDTGVVDALYSESATAPTMPTNYDQKRRLGAVLTDGVANILAFSQLGDEFLWDDPPLDVNVTNLSTTAVLYALSTPGGIKTWAVIQVHAQKAATDIEIYVSSPDQNDEAPSISAAPLHTQVAAAGGFSGDSKTVVRTNTSSQIRARSGDASTTFRVSPMGWVDDRGRND